jgi:hypothetical protein
MNIVVTEQPILIEAKTSGSYRKKSITYHVMESSHSLCLSKIEIISAQIQACERLFKYAKYETDLSTIEKQILELKFCLDLINF